jgi:hypothetical protein
VPPWGVGGIAGTGSAGDAGQQRSALVRAGPGKLPGQEESGTLTEMVSARRSEADWRIAMLAIRQSRQLGSAPPFCSIIALISSGKSRRPGHPEPPVGGFRQQQRPVATLNTSDFATRYFVVGIRTPVATNEPEDAKRPTRWETRSRSRQIAVNINAARSPICMPYNDTTPCNIWTDATS